MEQVVDWTAFASTGTLYTRVEAQGNVTPGTIVSVAITDQSTPLVVQGVANDPVHLSLLTDADLVREVACGSTPALEALYDRHVRGCFGLAVKIVRDPAVAEEVVQDVFLKLDAVCKPPAVLATNTSTLDVDAIADVTKRPEQVLGMHPEA